METTVKREKLVISVPEAAQLLGISASKMYKTVRTKVRMRLYAAFSSLELAKALFTIFIMIRQIKTPTTTKMTANKILLANPAPWVTAQFFSVSHIIINSLSKRYPYYISRTGRIKPEAKVSLSILHFSAIIAVSMIG